jgi:hypothetical protein
MVGRSESGGALAACEAATAEFEECLAQLRSAVRTAKGQMERATRDEERRRAFARLVDSILEGRWGNLRPFDGSKAYGQ